MISQRRQVRRGPFERGATVVLSALMVATPLGSAGAQTSEAAPTAVRMPSPDEFASVVGQPLVSAPFDVSDVDIDALGRAAFEQVRTIPAEYWNLEALAASLDFDPLAAFRFVRDHISYEPYRGVLRGAEGTLAARAGNAADRSLLLSALLDLMLVEHTFVFASLDDAEADLAIEAAMTPRMGPSELETPRVPVDAAALAARARRDFALLVETLVPHLAATPADGTHGPADDIGAREDARDHFWLQMEFGAESLDLDTTSPDAEPGDVIAAAESVLPELPDELYQGVEFRLIIEQLSAGAISEDVILESDILAADPLTAGVFLRFAPDLSSLGDAISQVLTGNEQWVPILLVDGDEILGRPFSSGGRGTDLLGDPTDLPELVALRLEATTTGPGLEPEVATHVLFDRRPDGISDSDSVEAGDLRPMTRVDGAPSELSGIYDILISTGGASPWLHALDQVSALDFLLRRLLDEETASLHRPADRLWPTAVADRALIMASEQITVPAAAPEHGISYVARPRVYLSSMAADPADSAALVQVYDLMIDGVRIVGADAAGTSTAVALQHVWYGVLQGALETELGIARSVAFEPASRRLEGVSLDMGPDLTVLAPGSPVDDAFHLDAGVVADLEAGRIVVFPSSGDPIRAWWSTDPITGSTRAMLAPGFRGYRDTVRESVAQTFDGMAGGVMGGYSYGRGAAGGFLEGELGGAHVVGPRCTGTHEYDIVLACASKAGLVLTVTVLVSSLVLLGYFIYLVQHAVGMKTVFDD